MISKAVSSLIAVWMVCLYVGLPRTEWLAYFTQPNFIFNADSSKHPFASSLSQSDIPRIALYEYNALFDLYNSTAGDDWAWGSATDAGIPWNFASPAVSDPCLDEWQGIACIVFNNESHVSEIDLPSMNLAGSLPDSIGAFSQLTILSLEENALSGSIPPSIGNLSALQYLYLSDNQLSYHIPDSIGNLTQLVRLNLDNTMIWSYIPLSFQYLVLLEELYLDNADIIGTLPDIVFASTTRLTELDLSTNYMSGTIPSVLLNSRALQYLNLGINLMTGTIPELHNSMSNLTIVQMDNNFFNGSLPVNIGYAALLQVLDVGYNQISGPLPDSMKYLSELYYLYIPTNSITGTLPHTFATASPLLSIIDMNENLFTGPYPESMWALTNLQFVDIGTNGFTGRIPDTIDNAQFLYEINLSDNGFYGTVPDSIRACASMYFVNLYANSFSGTVPHAFGALLEIEYLFLNYNEFTGTIPDSFAALPYLTRLDLDKNHITGTFPSTITGWYYLQELNVYNNIISGTLPAALSQLPYLNTLLAGNNKLHGTLDSLIDPSIQTTLAMIDISNNRFSGSLPAALFMLPLTTLSAVRNCFTGTLPATICLCHTLFTVALDGLSSSPACRNKILSFSDAYIVHHSLRGTIPTCVYTLPVLSVLHLSGNGFTGSLPTTLPPLRTSQPTAQPSKQPGIQQLSPFLIDMSLSHNQLSGTIPLMFQRKKWFNLDLSYNRISGTLSSEFANQNLTSEDWAILSDVLGIDVDGGVYDSTLSLENNRISGRIPSVLQGKQNISILGTNRFSCNVRASNLPQHDSGLNNYDCGSDSFNNPFYVWLGLVLVLLVTVVCMIWWCTDCAKTVDYVRTWNRTLYSSGITSIAPTLSRVLRLSDLLCKLTLCCTVFMLSVLAPAYVVLSHFYGAMVHQYAWMVSAGFVSGAVPFVVVSVLLLVLLVGVLVGYKRYIQRMSTTNTSAPSKHVVVSVFQTCTVYATFILLNLVFVIGANTAYVYVVIYHNSKVLLVAQLLLSCFKLMWNRFFSIYAIRYVANYNTDAEDATGDARMSMATRQRTVYTTYTSLQVFVALLNNIAIPCFVVAIVSPNCFYNVFVASPAVDTILVYETCSEIINDVCFQHYVGEHTIPYSPPFTYNYQCSSSIITSYAPAFVILCIVRTFVTPLLQYVLFVLYCKSTPGTPVHAVLSAVTLPVIKPLRANTANADSTDSVDAAQHVMTSSVYQPYFDGNQLLLSLVTYLGILLTFGAVFPPLAIALLLTLYSVLYTTKAKLGRFLTSVVELNQLQYIDTVENECKSSGIDTIVRRSVWMLITASCWYYTLFLFDTLGDAVGFDGAYWVLVVVPLIPVVLYASCYVVERMLATRANTEGAQGGAEERDTQDFEMRGTSSTVDTVNILHHRSTS